MNSFSTIGSSLVATKKFIDPDFNNDLYENTGLSFQGYTGSYYGGAVNAFNSVAVSRKITNLQSINTAFSGTGIDVGGDYFNGQWTGYFKSDFTGNFRFYLNTDNWTNFWLGDKARNNYVTGNRDLYDNHDIGTGEGGVLISLQAGRYYPIRIQFGEEWGGQLFQFYFVRNGATISNSTSYLYSVKSTVSIPRIGNPAVFI